MENSIKYRLHDKWLELKARYYMATKGFYSVKCAIHYVQEARSTIDLYAGLHGDAGLLADADDELMCAEEHLICLRPDLDIEP